MSIHSPPKTNLYWNFRHFIFFVSIYSVHLFFHSLILIFFFEFSTLPITPFKCPFTLQSLYFRKIPSCYSLISLYWVLIPHHYNRNSRCSHYSLIPKNIPVQIWIVNFYHSSDFPFFWRFGLPKFSTIYHDLPQFTTIDHQEFPKMTTV